MKLSELQNFLKRLDVKTYTKAQTTIHGTAQLQKRSFESQGTKKKSRLVLAKGF